MKNILLVILIWFFAENITAQSYFQDFNLNGNLPSGWYSTSSGSCFFSDWTTNYTSTGYSIAMIDGTSAVYTSSDPCGPGGGAYEYLYSPVFNTSSNTSIFLEFDQILAPPSGGQFEGNDTCIVEIFDGVNWVEIYKNGVNLGTNFNPNHQIINVSPYINANMQVRFIYNDFGNHEGGWTVDNFSISSNITEIKEIKKANELLIYPNPSNGIFRVLGKEIIKLEVIDVTGKVISQLINNSEYFIVNLQRYEKGIYFLKCYKEKNALVRKIIIE